jgi:tetratricopeptide (TPR) repeat protein
VNVELDRPRQAGKSLSVAGNTGRLGRSLASVLVLGVLATARTGEAQGPQPVDARVAQALDRARSDRGIGAYVALRELWRRWDQVDPAQVEEALGRVEQDTQVAPPVRAYAGMLGAYARRRRGDLAGARNKLNALGYIDRWLVVGPFDNEAKSSLFTRFGPEEDLAAPLSTSKTYEGKERPAAWRPLPDPSSFGWLDLGNVVRPAEKVCVYASSFLRATPPRKDAPKETRASLWVGAAGSFRAFWNGEEVLNDPDLRSLDADRIGTKVTLQAGWNRLTLKVCGDEEGPMLQVRLGTEDGGSGLAFESKNDPALGEAAAKNSRGPAEKASPGADPEGKIKITAKGDPYARGATGNAPTRRMPPAMGPLVSVGRVLGERRPPAAQLEAHARYLAQTGGTPRGQNTARDLAIRAAEAEPTVPRLLLAAELAEDRNARAAWITRARALGPSDDQDRDVLLAEALLARSGTNFRDATPYFEKILLREPNHIAATLGKTELYEEAGLRYSALAVLEEAVQRSPHSVALLRAYARQLRVVGRATEAEAVEQRYANLRFDDVTHLRSRVELAVARRDVPGGTRWLERLLELDPESFGTLDFASRAFRALGQKDRAVALLERRLENAPEDVDALRALADLQGEEGKEEEQTKLLRRVLALQPQAKDVREYLEHKQPPKIRRDEAFAWSKEKILEQSKQPAPPGGFPKRTLRDLQVTTVYPNGLASRFHQVAYQPLTEEGAASGRQYSFAYQAGREVIDLRAARVYRADGKVDEAIETGEGATDNPALAMYSSTRLFYVQMPRLGPGDVVELRYRVEEITPRNEYGDNFSETAFLQATEPLASSEYVLIQPKDRKINLRLPALKDLTREEKDEGELKILRLVASAPPPLLTEPFAPPLGELAASVGVSTFATWNEVGAWFWGLSKDQLDSDEEVRKKVAEITRGKTDELEKIRAVYGYVVQRTRYVALEFGIEGFRPRRCAQTLARGWGDCKDKAAVLVTMLRELGIEASMVLVRTGMRGEGPSDPPSYAFFDHAIAYVPKYNLFLDGTAEYTGMNELPAMDRGAYGLIVKAGGEASLVKLPEPPAEATLRSRRIELTIPESGPSAIEARIETTGALAAEWRQGFHALGTQRARVAAELGAQFGGLSLAAGSQGLEVNDLEDIEQPVKIRFRGKSSAMSRAAGSDLAFSISPVASLVARYAPLSARKLDVKLPFALGFDDEWVIKAPSGNAVKQTPADKTLQSPYGRLELKTETGPGKATVKVKLRLDKTRIPPAEYEAFRKFCEEVDRALGERVVVGARL